MPSFNASNRRKLTLLSLLCLLALASATRGQQQQGQPQNQTTDVIRINTELVQTDLMVFDRQGRFVDGLKPDQFELKLDGKPQTISFFERVATGSVAEAGQLAAASGASLRKEATTTTTAEAQDRRRLLFFFLDDRHLSPSSLIRARKALTEFIENQMSQDDRVAIVSTSGQIGFLQQLTDNKAVLYKAIARLNYKRNPEVYPSGKVPISENDANQVQNARDRTLFMYLVQATQKEYQTSALEAANIVKNRVRQINVQSQTEAAETLNVLQSLMRSSSALPGRKLVVFMSDGFLVDLRRSNALDIMRRVTDEAARAGVVVYTMDVRGTFSDAAVDAGRNDYPDLSSPRLARNIFQEATATQEPLRILADNTGGRAILNSNSIPDAILQSLKETNDYYLLAWHPDSAEQRNGKFRIKVSIKDRPDLTVRLRSSFYSPPPAAANQPGDESAAQAHPPEAELLTALGSLYPNKQLSTSISAGYINTPASGQALRVSMQIERDALDFDSDGGSQKREVDVIGAAIDDRGIIKTFKQLLTVTNDPSARSRALPVIWNQELGLPPGLYQVRVAVRERQTGRTGSAMQWIEVPDLSKGSFNLSSLFLGERKIEEVASAGSTKAPQAIRVNVDHRFARTSVLRFQTYIYNATARGASSAPDVWIQTQVLRDDRPLVVMPASKVPSDASTDQARLPYWSEISLEQLPAGRYALVVTATDRNTKASATQRVSFVVE
jgi:VWFA-related protein